MKRFLTAFMLSIALLSVTGCASMKRFSRTNSEHVLQSKYATIDENTVNLWPLFISSGAYCSVLWPLADFDDHGFAVRPLINVEDDDWSILWPLMAWDHNGTNGWCGLGYWNTKEGYCGLFPLFHYNPKPDSVRYVGPFWWNHGKKLQLGLFPLIWSLDSNFMCFPLCYANANGFYSIPVSWYREKFEWDRKRSVYPWTSVSQLNSGFSKHPVGLDGLYRKTAREWYYAFLAYGGKNHLRVVESSHPEFKIYGEYPSDYYLRYLWQRNGNKGKPTDAFRRQFLLKLEDEISHADTEKWFGVLPLFHYESYKTNWQLVFFGGLLGNMKRTPAEYHNSFLTFLFNQTHKYTHDEDEVDRRTEKSLLVTPLVINTEKQYYEMSPEARLRFADIYEGTLRNRLTLLDPKSIAQWEKEFASLADRSPASSVIKVNGVYRTIYRTKPIPVPKTEAEVLALLKQFKDPANYIPVTEKFCLYGPYMRNEKQTGNELSHSDLLLFGLLSYYGVKPDSTFFHFLGPFGYLSSHDFASGEYERERKDSKFRMSLLGYWGTKEKWRPAAFWKKQFGGVDEDALRRRIILSDQKKIAEWENNLAVNLAAETPESTVKVPKNVDETKALLAEMNKTQYYEKFVEKYFGIAPLFHYRNSTDGYLFNILLGLPTAAGKDPEGEFFHILGPLGYLYTQKHHSPGAAERDAFQEKTRISLLAFTHDEWRYKPADAYRKRYDFLMENRWRLLRRLRLIGKDEIARWEHEFRCEAWFNDPVNPMKIPASVAEVRAMLAELDDLKNYRKAEQSAFGFFPLFSYENGTEEQKFNLLGILADWEKDRNGDSEFGVLLPVGYRRWQKKDETGFQAFLAYGKEENFETWADPLLAQFRYDLERRIELYPQTAKALKDWRLKFEWDLWQHDPLSAIRIPENVDEAKAMYLKAEKKKTVTKKEWGVFPFYTHEESSNGMQSDDVLFGLLSSYEKDNNSSSFHILGPFAFLSTQETEKGKFPVDTKKEDFRMSLLFYRFADESFVPNGQYKAAFGTHSRAEDSVAGEIDHYYHRELYPKNTRKTDFAGRVSATLRMDGTYAVKAPENVNDAKKLYLEMHDEKYYDKDIYSGFGFFPLFHYGSNGKDRVKFNIPLLLSWHNRNKQESSTKIFCGLLYSGGSKKGQVLRQVEFVHDLPWQCNIWDPSDVEDFIDGELDLEYETQQWESRRIMLVLARTTGKVTAWKKNTPQAVKKEFSKLHYLKNSTDSKKYKFTPADAARMKKIIDDHTETVDVYERGNMGKLLLRYASFGEDRASMWLGGGLLAKYNRAGVKEDTSVLGFLYRSSKDEEGTTRVCFPFIRHHNGKTRSSFSFLGPFFEVKKDQKKGWSSRILFIPFD